MKIALIEPVIAGHKIRGTGIYADRLYQSLLEKGVTVERVQFNTRLDGFDIAHYPYFDPFFLTLPLKKKITTVVTVHDLIPFRYPEYFPPGLRGNIKWQIQKRILQSSDAIITDSLASAKDIYKYTGISKAKLNVIYLGAGEDYRMIRNKSGLEKLRNKFRLPERFMLYVGDINYNKNIPGLFQTFGEVGKTYQDLGLVVVGEGFVRKSKPLQEYMLLAEQLGINNKISILGKVDLTELIGLYNLAALYAQLSICEGFGLPVLDAMACGCPVVCSNGGSLPEIAGDAAIIADPSNVQDMAKGILDVLKYEKIRNNLISCGLERVKLFSWDKCAQETLNVYKSLLVGFKTPQNTATA